MTARSPGISSRVHRCPSPHQVWVAPGGFDLEMPIVVDLVSTDQHTGAERWRVDATVDLVAQRPTLTALSIASADGLSTDYLQQNFRWATPVDIVTITIPQLLARGIDPFEHDLPIDGLPTAAYVDRSIKTRLSDEFLEEIAARYIVLGRGYAKAIAEERNVSPRTAISWVEKARERGILTATTAGAVGGTLVARRNLPSS